MIASDTTLNNIYDAGTSALQQGRLDEAIGLLRQVVTHSSDESLSCLAWANLGVGLRRQDRHEEAREAFETALMRDPTSITARFNLANTLHSLKRHTEALNQYQAVLSQAPHRADVANNMGAVLMAMGHTRDAEKCFAQASRLDPDDPLALGNLASAQASNGKVLAPLRTLQRALKLDPASASAHIKLGHILTEQGHIGAAKKAFLSARRLDPVRPDAAAGLAQVLHREGDNEAASAILAPMIQSGVLQPNLVATWTQVCRRTGQPEKAIAPLKAQIEATSEPASLSLLHHGLGDVLDAMGEHDQAFAAHARANALRGLPHSPENHSAWVDQIIAQPTDGPTSSLTSQVPVFIVGMPRSGTSIVEQILASHPAVYGAGELDEIRQISLMAGRGSQAMFPHCLPSLQTAELDRLGEAYLSRATRSAGHATRISDKMPQNFLYLGLISKMLPGARVIHCVRDPADTALSCFFQNFKNTLAFSTELSWLESWSRDYQRLMAHWRQNLQLPLFDVQYESLCHDPETWTRRILDFVGLDWDAQCLQPHSHSRVVRTASYAQVRTPIYKTSIGRADAYAAHVPGLIALRSTDSPDPRSNESEEHPKKTRTDG